MAFDPNGSRHFTDMFDRYIASRHPPVPVITCDLCQKPCEMIHVWENPAKRTVQVTVECHGESDTCEVDPMLLADYLRLGNWTGIAFKQPHTLLSDSHG